MLLELRDKSSYITSHVPLGHGVDLSWPSRAPGRRPDPNRL